MNPNFPTYNPEREPEVPSLSAPEARDFVGRVILTAERLRKELPQIHMGIPITVLEEERDQVWNKIVQAIIDEYPEYTETLSRTGLAFRVAYRPYSNNDVLPGYNHRNINTETLIFRYGMEYEPQPGEWIGMTPGSPWINYLMPGCFTTDVISHIFVYDNSQGQLLAPDGTACLITHDNMLTDHILMHIEVVWREHSKYDFINVITANDASKGQGAFLQKAWDWYMRVQEQIKRTKGML